MSISSSQGSSYFDNVITEIGHGDHAAGRKIILDYSLGDRDASNNPVIRRLSLGVAARLCETEICHTCDSSICAAQLNDNAAVPLIRSTSCVDPRCSHVAGLGLKLRQTQADNYAGICVPAFNPQAPHSFYAHLDLYMRWLANPEVVAHYGDFGDGEYRGRPTILLVSHNDCGFANYLSKLPSAGRTSVLPLDVVASQELPFRDAMQRQYDQSPHREEVSFGNYLAIQLARQTCLRTVQALDFLVNAMVVANPDIPKLNPNFVHPIVIPLHDRMDDSYALIHPLEENGLRPVIDFSTSRQHENCMMSHCMRYHPRRTDSHSHVLANLGYLGF